jgi:hypothetical protein
VPKVFEMKRFHAPYEATQYFQRLGVHVNPFQVPDGVKNNTFIKWLLGGPYTFFVDMQGLRYFSELEKIIYLLRPDVQALYHEPYGKDYWGFKFWFESSGSKDHDIHGKIMRRWKSELVAHTALALSQEQAVLGVNVLGWHFGLFEQGFSGFCVFFGLKSTGIDVKATNLYDAREYPHTSDRIGANDLTRSFKRPINIVVANADYTSKLLSSYADGMWDEHYNIGR